MTKYYDELPTDLADLTKILIKTMNPAKVKQIRQKAFDLHGVDLNPTASTPLKNPNNAGRKPTPAHLQRKNNHKKRHDPTLKGAVDLSKPLSQAEAARHLLRVMDGSSSFRGFTVLTSHIHGMPDLFHKYPAFEQDLIDKLDQIEKGTLKRLLICMPPRVCKSTLGSQLLPSYFLLADPKRNVIATSYNADLAGDFARKVKTYVTDPIVQQAFPDFQIAKDSRANDRWNTTQGGQYTAVGFGGTATGRGANLLIIDDPIKNRQEANSATKRNFVWQEYIDTFHSRLEKDQHNNDAAIIMILTRWHPDDIAGRLQKSAYWKEEGWEKVEIKAIQNEGTEKECSFWEERFPLKSLKLKQKENPSNFAALFQQSPSIEGGNIVKHDWWQYYDEEPVIQSKIIAYDTAFSTKTTADYTVAITFGLGTDGNIYILDLLRERLAFPDLKRKAIQLNNEHRGKGLIGHYIEDKASGQSLVQELKNQSGMAVIPKKVSADKETRLHQVLGLIEGGRVYLPRMAPWLDDFIEEVSNFPASTHDDQVDALTLGLDVLSKLTYHAQDIYKGSLDNYYMDGMEPLENSNPMWGEL